VTPAVAPSRITERDVVRLPAIGDSSVRGRVFQHVAGVVVVPTMAALAGRGITALLRNAGPGISLESIADQAGANRAYLRVALRLLASAGWLIEDLSADRRSVSYRITPAGQAALDLAPELWQQAAGLLPTAARLRDLFSEPDLQAVDTLGEATCRIARGWGIEGDADVDRQLRLYLDGVVVSPVMVTLAQSGIFDVLAAGPMRLLQVDDLLRCLFDVLETQGWLAAKGAEVHLTPEGASAAAIARAYGTTVSYLPMLSELAQLLSGAPVSRRSRERSLKTSVDRPTNVWGSAANAPPWYIEKVDELIVDVFNRPLAEQPVGICEVGCGSGALLEHVYRVVRDRTARGGLLRQHPLVIVGVDHHTSTRHVAAKALQGAGPAVHVVPGDVGRPAQLARTLARFHVDMHDLLHIRSFADHSRADIHIAQGRAAMQDPLSTGAFAYRGQQVFAAEIEADLVRHFRQWKPYIERFGMLVAELHALPPAVTAEHLDRTPVMAYEATHGYSDQFLVEIPVFLACARKAGLDRDPRFRAQFPSSDVGTVSLNFFTVPNGMKGVKAPGWE